MRRIVDLKKIVRQVVDFYNLSLTHARSGITVASPERAGEDELIQRLPVRIEHLRDTGEFGALPVV